MKGHLNSIADEQCRWPSVLEVAVYDKIDIPCNPRFLAERKLFQATTEVADCEVRLVEDFEGSSSVQAVDTPFGQRLYFGLASNSLEIFLWQEPELRIGET